MNKLPVLAFRFYKYIYI